MKIHFGTTYNSAWRAFIIGGGIFIIEVSLVFCNEHLDKSHEFTLRSRMPNVTSAEISLYCGLPYDECLCSAQLIESQNTEYCITNVQLIIYRILPLVLFILECFLVRELFSFSVDCTRVFVYILWILSVFISIGITVGVHWSSCYQYYISCVLVGAIPFLVCPSTCNWYHHMERARQARINNPIVYVQCPERIDIEAVPNNQATSNNEAKSWRELL